MTGHEEQFHGLVMNSARSRQRPALRTYHWILFRALCLGTWDLLFARVYWNSEGVTLVRVLGLAYAIFLYFFMNLVKLPLSAIGHPAFGDHRWMACSIGMHALFGVFCGLTTRRALGVTQRASTR